MSVYVPTIEPSVTHLGCVSRQREGLEPSSIVGEFTHSANPLLLLVLPGKGKLIAPGQPCQVALLALSTKSYTTVGRWRRTSVGLRMMPVLGVGEGVSVGGSGVFVGAGTTMTTVRFEPKMVASLALMRHAPLCVPGSEGATRFTATSVAAPTATGDNGTDAGPPICSPLANTNWNPSPQSHVPEFLTRHVLTNALPGAMDVLSGIVTSATNAAFKLQPADAGIAVG